MAAVYFLLVCLHIFLVITATNPLSLACFGIALFCWAFCLFSSLED